VFRVAGAQCKLGTHARSAGETLYTRRCCDAQVAKLQLEACDAELSSWRRCFFYGPGTSISPPPTSHLRDLISTTSSSPIDCTYTRFHRAAVGGACPGTFRDYCLHVCSVTKQWGFRCVDCRVVVSRLPFAVPTPSNRRFIFRSRLSIPHGMMRLRIHMDYWDDLEFFAVQLGATDEAWQRKLQKPVFAVSAIWTWPADCRRRC
jgi:hypothetical protein